MLMGLALSTYLIVGALQLYSEFDELKQMPVRRDDEGVVDGGVT